MSLEVIDVLKDIQAGAFQNAAPLPLKTDVEPEWQGLGFQVGGIRLVAALGEVSEILQMPRLTKLPGTKDWVMGVANVRGRLLPIIDTHRYLGLTPTLSKHEWRLIVVEDGEIACGMVIEQSLGMQYFLEDSFEHSAPDDVESVRPFVKGAYRHGGRVFYVFSLKALVNDDEFLDVAG